MNPPPTALGAGAQHALARSRLLALDVDGVLTDGRVIYGVDDEIQAFSVYDGQGLLWLQRAGVQVAWISGRGARATERRAAELGVVELHLRVPDKAEALREIQVRLGIAPEETVAMGDDLPDLALAARATFFAAPSNARPEVKSRAQLVTSRSGGDGAVRELSEHILRAKGAWPALLEAAASRGP